MARKSAGRRLFESIAAAFELDRREVAVLELAAAVADEIEVLEAELRGQRRLVETHAGTVKANPLVTELRQQRAQLGSLLNCLVDQDAKGPSGSAVSDAMRHAVAARWAKAKPRVV
jgi:hypothetical protein